MEPYDSIQNLRTYTMQNRIPFGRTTEETVNLILEDLARRLDNRLGGNYRPELISSAAVVLMGIGRIKDPVRLYRNLTDAFEKRGQCIFTNTVERALIRLQNSAIEQGKEKEIIAIWGTLRNETARSTLSNRLSLGFLRSATNSENIFRERVYEALFTHKDFSKEDLFRSTTRELPPARAIIYSLQKRKDITNEELIGLLSHRYETVKSGAAFILFQRSLTSQELTRIFQKWNLAIIQALAHFIKVKKRFSLREIEKYLSPEQKKGLNYELESIARTEPLKKRESVLAHIKGSRGKRRRTMLRMTKPLRA